MAHRRKKDTEKTLELVIWLILGIPMAIIVVLKWIFSGIKKMGPNLQSNWSVLICKILTQWMAFRSNIFSPR